MHRPGIGVFAAALFLYPLFAIAEQVDGNTAATAYFGHACAEGAEHVAVYAPATRSLIDITANSSPRTVAWDAAKLEQLCPLPQLSVYHCHTTHDVLTPFPSGSDDGSPGDIGAAAEMEFTCAKAAALSGRSGATLVHRLVTPQGEITEYGLTSTVVETIRAQGRNFARLLENDAPRNNLDAAYAAAERSFSDLNAAYFTRFVDFAATNCRSADIEHCGALTVEHFAASLSSDDRMFVRAETGAGPAAKPVAAASSPSPADDITRIALQPDGVAELTPEGLGAFVASGSAMVGFCAQDANDLRPCAETETRMLRLAVSCPRIRLAILDQDKYPDAKYLYPVAKDRSLLLFGKNPQSGLNEQFNLTTMGEPTPALISLLFCSSTFFGASSF